MQPASTIDRTDDASKYDVRIRKDGKWEYGMKPVREKKMPKSSMAKPAQEKNTPKSSNANVKEECTEHVKKEDDADEIDVIGPLAAPVETDPYMTFVNDKGDEEDDGPPDPREMLHYNTCSTEADSGESAECDDTLGQSPSAAARRRARQKRSVSSTMINREKRGLKKSRDARWFLETYAPGVPVPPHLQRGTANSMPMVGSSGNTPPDVSYPSSYMPVVCSSSTTPPHQIAYDELIAALDKVLAN